MFGDLFKDVVMGSDGVLAFNGKQLEYTPTEFGKKGKEILPIDEVVRIGLEDGADVSSRITATRLVLTGVFALAFKKKSGGEKFVTVEGSNGEFWAVEVPRKRVKGAAKFVQRVRMEAAKVRKGKHRT